MLKSPSNGGAMDSMSQRIVDRDTTPFGLEQSLSLGTTDEKRDWIQKLHEGASFVVSGLKITSI